LYFFPLSPATKGFPRSKSETASPNEKARLAETAKGSWGLGGTLTGSPGTKGLVSASALWVVFERGVRIFEENAVYLVGSGVKG